MSDTVTTDDVRGVDLSGDLEAYSLAISEFYLRGETEEELARRMEAILSHMMSFYSGVMKIKLGVSDECGDLCSDEHGNCISCPPTIRARLAASKAAKT